MQEIVITKRVGAAIKAELRQRWPEARWVVRAFHPNCVLVQWHDGPGIADVETVARNVPGAMKVAGSFSTVEIRQLGSAHIGLTGVVLVHTVST